jgi:dienelactone hydrolase
LLALKRAHAGPVPLLIAAPRDSRGTVIWHHGFGVDKDTHETELRRFAAEGYTAVAVDAVGHGERRAPDLDERRAGSQEDAFFSVVEFADATGREMPALYDHLIDRGLGRSGRVAIAGISMGAFVVYRAIAVEPRFNAAVAILGSPEWPGADSPHLQVGELCRVPLLSITGARDSNVPPAPARRLHARLDAECLAKRHRYIEIPGAAHLMAPKQWDVVMDNTIEWLRQWSSGFKEGT